MTSTEAWTALKQSEELFVFADEIAPVIGCTADTLRQAAKDGYLPFKFVRLSKSSFKFNRLDFIQFVEGRKK